MGEASGNLDDIVARINNAPGMVSAWEALSGLPQIFRNLDNITAVDAFEKINSGSLDAIENIAITIKSSRRQSFLNALDRISDNNILGQTLTKSRIASADEIKDTLNKIRDYRSGVPSGGNYGYIDGNVTGVTIDNNKMWRSVSLAGSESSLIQKKIKKIQSLVAGLTTRYHYLFVSRQLIEKQIFMLQHLILPALTQAPAPQVSAPPPPR